MMVTPHHTIRCAMSSNDEIPSSNFQKIGNRPQQKYASAAAMTPDLN
jgi:hypothetical protein